MNNIYKIVLVSFVLSCLGFARVSENHSGPAQFINKGTTQKKMFVPSERTDEGENSVKWKRRHKRRKKAKNKKSQRGR